MSGPVTIVVVSHALRREHSIDPAETFAVMCDGEVLHTGKDKPACIAPVQWARDIAAHLGVPFVEPDPSANFAVHDGQWWAYSCDPVVVRSAWTWDSQPWVGVIRSAGSPDGRAAA